MKKLPIIFLLLFCLTSYAQNSINNYKYIIVPEKFDFFKQVDQYKLNSLAKALLEDKGFTVYFDNSTLPDEIANNKCNALTLSVIQKNSMFSTNLRMLLKDCHGKVILETKQGSSREKEYNVSYNLALRDAFSSIADTPYSFEPIENQQTTVAAQTNVPTAPLSSPAPRPVVSADGKVPDNPLYAQPTNNGYQLIDTAPKIIMTLFKTSVEGTYIATHSKATGLVFKKNNEWFFEYYKGNELIAERLLIKF